MVACPALVGELTDVLRRPKLAPYVSGEDATAFVDSIIGTAEMHQDPQAHPGALRDPADEYLVGLAVEANADLIVSGDRDLLDASIPMAVISPRALLERLAER